MSTKLLPTECAACGNILGEQRYGKYEDFCSLECRNIGRAFCKSCGVPLIQNKKSRRDFCLGRCASMYRMGIDPSYLKEQKRSSCKNCGKPLEQPNEKRPRHFCPGGICAQSYYRAHTYKLSTTERWGAYAPETRKILLELERLNLSGTARHLAIAIDREYVLRVKRDISHSGGYKPDGRPMTHHVCKKCGVPFRRVPTSRASREYCDPCTKNTGIGKGAIENNIGAKLTWELVNEIRALHKTGQWSAKALAEKYNVTDKTIYRIVLYRAWVPEGLSVEPAPNRIMKLTWEYVDDIRHSYATGNVSLRTLAEKYDVHPSLISQVIKGKKWKPENDPRYKTKRETTKIMRDNYQRLIKEQEAQ